MRIECGSQLGPAMRAFLIGLIVLLAACAPQETPSAQPVSDLARGDANAAALTAAPASGTWVFYGTMDYNSVCYGRFGAPESECKISIQCNIESGNITIIHRHELAGQREARLDLLTSRTSIALTARLVEADSSAVAAEVADPNGINLLKRMLMPTQERFAVQIAGETMVFPWNDEIYYLLLACE